VTPDDPRLWCALGDLTLKDEHYKTAWLRSSQRSTRAQRSLARSAQREKDYEKVPFPNISPGASQSVVCPPVQVVYCVSELPRL
jgi:hypothetical protein